MSKIIVAALAFAGFAAIPSALQAGPPPGGHPRADRNHDGVIGPREADLRHKVLQKKRAAVDRPWEVHADANQNGRVDPEELRGYHLSVMDSDHDGKIDLAERKTYWHSYRAVVNTEAERKNDLNGDGYIEWNEARALLKDRMTVAKTDGKAIANTSIEKQFDLNGDGIIDGPEAAALHEVVDD